MPILGFNKLVSGLQYKPVKIGHLLNIGQIFLHEGCPQGRSQKLFVGGQDGAIDIFQ